MSISIPNSVSVINTTSQIPALGQDLQSYYSPTLNGAGWVCKIVEISTGEVVVEVPVPLNVGGSKSGATPDKLVDLTI